MVIVWIAFCCFVGKLTTDFFTNVNSFCSCDFTLIIDMSVKIFYFQSCFCFRNDFAFCYIGCLIMATYKKNYQSNKAEDKYLCLVFEFLYFISFHFFYSSFQLFKRKNPNHKVVKTIILNGIIFPLLAFILPKLVSKQ